MQLTITFKKDRITLPMANAHILQGLIYKALREDARYSKDVHDCGHALENDWNFCPYCSCQIARPEIEDQIEDQVKNQQESEIIEAELADEEVIEPDMNTEEQTAENAVPDTEPAADNDVNIDA